MYICDEWVAPCQEILTSEGSPYLQRRVIELRHGLNDEPPRTGAEVARTLRLSLEKLTQIENASLAALRGASQR